MIADMRLGLVVIIGIGAFFLLAAPVVARAETLSPLGSDVRGPVTFEEEPWNKEGAERAAAEAPRLEEEREAKQKEEEERPAKEVAERATKERETREAGERAGREAAKRERAEAERTAASSVRCVVPRLKGDSLRTALRILHKRHCRLGKVIESRQHGRLVVATQSIRAGHKLPEGAAIAVKLGLIR